jgi:hypothetical protein
MNSFSGARHLPRHAKLADLERHAPRPQVAHPPQAPEPTRSRLERLIRHPVKTTKNALARLGRLAAN